MKVKFESNDNLPTDKTINIYLAIVVIRNVFAQNGKILSSAIFRWWAL